MLLGLVMLTAAWGLTLNGWVICYTWALFFYGIGVGGEYPMTATSGMENAVGSGRISTKEDRLHRGRKVTSAFLMQGWGQLINQALLIILLLIFHHGSGNYPYSAVAAQWTYRVSFAIPAVGTLWLVYYRVFCMKSAGRQLAAAKSKGGVTGYDTESLKMTVRHFGSRLFATAAAWYCNDIFFYGNKLFQSQFISVLMPGNKSIMPGWLYNLINCGASLGGYYAASFLIDSKLYGRRKMQILGFLMCFVLFIVPAFHYHYYTEKPHVQAFQAMYFLSSFFNQFGPNSVTFLVAAEVYPTPIRASAHGFSAATGKLGALTAAVLYNYIDTQTKFYVVPWFGLAGTVITFFFLPDTTGLDLKEQERRWYFIREGREADYHGPAIHPKHLSIWERFRGIGRHYNAELDYQQKVDEMRHDWEVLMARRASLATVTATEKTNPVYGSSVKSPITPAMSPGSGLAPRSPAVPAAVAGTPRSRGKGSVSLPASPAVGADVEQLGDIDDVHHDDLHEGLRHQHVRGYFERTSPMIMARTPRTPASVAKEMREKESSKTSEEGDGFEPLPPPAEE